MIDHLLLGEEYGLLFLWYGRGNINSSDVHIVSLLLLQWFSNTLCPPGFWLICSLLMLKSMANIPQRLMTGTKTAACGITTNLTTFTSDLAVKTWGLPETLIWSWLGWSSDKPHFIPAMVTPFRQDPYGNQGCLRKAHPQNHFLP